LHPGFKYDDRINELCKISQTTLHQVELNDIIKACKTNDSIAQERLYKHFFALMFSICKPYSDDKQTILSIINEGFLKIFTNIKNFDSELGSFEGWAKKIVTNTAIDFVRSPKNKNQFVELKDEHDDEKSLQQLPDNHAEEEVLYLIKKLPPVTQNVFSLHIFKGYSHIEISKMLGIAESTSRWHVAEAFLSMEQQQRIF
jgi:RNA polymerase sigma factor (sigma-70 family)